MPYTVDDLKGELRGLFATLMKRVSTESGEWTVKGFIDIYQHIYTVSTDTKVLSKILELMLFPILHEFAIERGFAVDLAAHQNHYPDLSLTTPDNVRFALDIKTTYRTDVEHVNGMTLGAFTGYFRDRVYAKNITYSYNAYAEHLVLGIIYSSVESVDERRTYTLDQLASIPSVAQNFELFVHEKYRIASDRPGSGNTKNIGSVTKRQTLIDGKGPFAALGRDIFDDYWMFYLTNDMARSVELPHPPYHNLDEYLTYRGLNRK